MYVEQKNWSTYTHQSLLHIWLPEATTPRFFSIWIKEHLETLCRMLNFGCGLFIKLATVTAWLFLTQWRNCKTHFTSESKSYEATTWGCIWQREDLGSIVWCVSDVDRWKFLKGDKKKNTKQNSLYEQDWGFISLFMF